jgi:hypothetical protein
VAHEFLSGDLFIDSTAYSESSPVRWANSFDIDLGFRGEFIITIYMSMYQMKKAVEGIDG